MEMHYRLNEFQNFLQNLALDAHGGLYQKSALAFIRHCSRVGENDKLAIDKGGNLPEKVENHWVRSTLHLLLIPPPSDVEKRGYIIDTMNAVWGANLLYTPNLFFF